MSTSCAAELVFFLRVHPISFVCVQSNERQIHTVGLESEQLIESRRKNEQSKAKSVSATVKAPEKKKKKKKVSCICCTTSQLQEICKRLKRKETRTDLKDTHSVFW